MNMRWKADFINLNQHLGLEHVRFRFSPTQHDPLAQAPGHFSYFIDEKGDWWRCLWEHELEDESFVKKGNESYFQLIDEFVFELKSMHGQSIPAGYRVKMRYTYKDKAGTIEVVDGSEINIGERNEIHVACIHGKLYLKLDKGNGMLRLSEIVISPVAG